LEPLALLEMAVILLTIGCAFLAVEFRNIPKAIASFFFMSILLAVAFFLLGAPYVAAVQVLIYVGAVVVLLLVTFHTVKKL
jgi:NADH-quinone oxidoreductase subunit J